MGPGMILDPQEVRSILASEVEPAGRACPYAPRIAAINPRVSSIISAALSP